MVDERTLREIYTTDFEIAVKEGKAKTIMFSYNEVNGVYANENRHLLQDILVKEWGNRQKEKPLMWRYIINWLKERRRKVLYF